VIRSFASRDTEELFNGESPRKFRSFQEQTERKLRIIDSAKQSVSRSHAKVAQ
jgi:plasmid maintenance system killer protein